jgi:carbamoyl-phosphate synthase large subunit
MATARKKRIEGRTYQIFTKAVMKRILITGVGGPTPRSFVRAIKLYGGEKADNFEFVGVDANPLAYGLYERALFTKSFVVPKANEEDYWMDINKIISDCEIDGAIVLPEVEVLEWAQNHSKLEKAIKLHLPNYNLANKLVNKYKLHAQLVDTDYVPKFRKIDPKNFSYKDVQQSLGDTFWVRSTEGSSGLGSLKIDREASLHQWISINPLVAEFIATEYLPGRNMACKLLYFNGKLIRTACAERVNYIMAKVAPSGITGNTSFGRLLNEQILVEISAKVLNKLALACDTDLNGIFTVDYKEDANGSPRITEINIRHVAFTSSLAAGGANLPLDTLEGMFLDEPETMESIHYSFEDGLIFLRDVDGEPILMKEEDLLKFTQ